MSAIRIPLLAVAVAVGCNQPPDDPNGDPSRYAPPAGGWELTWSDEFDGPAGTPPDATRWNHDVGTEWGNAQLEFDTDRVDNAFQDGNGSLVIRAIAQPYRGRLYTSARLNTRGRLDQQYGRFEARIRLPYGRGIWPALWLLGSDVGEAGWPECGEIDIFEGKGQELGTVHGSLHGPSYSGGGALTRDYTLPNGAAFRDDFHVFAIEWSPEAIHWIVDDVAYQTREPTDPELAGRQWVFDHAFFIILNLAVGGNYVGAPDGSTSFPQDMVVDYVRVYAQRG